MCTDNQSVFLRLWLFKIQLDKKYSCEKRMLLCIKGFYSTKIYKEHYWFVNIYSWIWIHFCPFTLKPKGCLWKYNEHTWLPCFPKVIMDSSTSPCVKLKVTFKSLLCLLKVWFKASHEQCLPSTPVSGDTAQMMGDITEATTFGMN